MSYEKQVWTDGVSPLDAERMNHMEQGIATAHNDIQALQESGGISGGTTIEETGTIVKLNCDAGAELKVSGETIETVTVIHQGKNFFPSVLQESGTKNGITWTTNADGSIHVSGTATVNTYIDIGTGDDPVCLPAGNYMVSAGGEGTASVVFYVALSPGSDAAFSAIVTYANAPKAITVSQYTNTAQAYVYVGAGQTVDTDVWWQIEEGTSLPTEYEPYTSAEYAGALPITVSAYDGTNILWTATGDELTVSSKKSISDIIDAAVAKKVGIDWSAYGLPIIYLTGDTTGMTKDDYVDLAYVYGERSGTVSVKWQGSSSLAYPKKNYTMKFDTAFEAKSGWGEQKKYCFKANWIDHSHSRNVVNAKLWGQIVKSRAEVPERLANLVNGGAVDGFPCIIMLNGEFLGLYTWNIPKDGWMLGMGAEGGMSSDTGVVAKVSANAGGAITVSSDTTESVTVVHHSRNFVRTKDHSPATVTGGITITNGADGTLNISGTATGVAYAHFADPADPFYLPAGTYIMSSPVEPDGITIEVATIADGVETNVGVLYNNDSGVIKSRPFVLDDGAYIIAWGRIPIGTTVNKMIQLQIEQKTEDGLPTEYIPSNRTELSTTLPISVEACAGTNFLYTTTGDEITVTTDGGKMETILCASGNSSGYAIEGFKAPVTEWGTGFDLEFIADDSEENQAAVMASVNNLINACINSDGTDLDTTIAEMLDWDSAIDHYIFATLIAGHDVQLKNYLLYTFNGKKWYFGEYDMDCTYGLHWNGGSWVSASYPARFDTMALAHRLFYLIQNYKKDEVKARYEELRNSVMSENNIYLMFSNFCGGIPKGVYLADAERWPTTPNTSGNDVGQILNYYRMRLAGADIWVESMHR